MYVSDKRQHRCLTPGQRGGHVDANAEIDLSEFAESSRSHLGIVKVYMYKGEFETPDIEASFTQVNTALVRLLAQLYDIHQTYKVEINVGVKIQKDFTSADGLYTREDMMYFKSNLEELLDPGEVDTIIKKCADRIITKKNNFLDNSSNWYIVKVESFQVKIGEIRLFQNARGQRHLKMPLNRQGFINFKNKDILCYHYCVLASIFWEEQKEVNRNVGRNNQKSLRSHVTWRGYLNRLNFEHVTPDVDIYYGIPRFEDANEISVTVFTHQNGEVVLMRRGNLTYSRRVFLFLIWEKQEDESVKYHFVLIRDLDKFLGHMKVGNVAYFCQKCFRHFTTKERMHSHSSGCNGCVAESEVIEEFPPDDERLEFHRAEMTIEYPLVLYWDTETYSKPMLDGENKRGKGTTLNYKYEPASYSLVGVSKDINGEKVSHCEYYDKENPIEHFLERTFAIAEEYIAHIRMTNNMLQPTQAELDAHNQASVCFLCRTEFTCHKTFMELLNDMDPSDPHPRFPKKVVKTFHHNHQNG